MEKQTAVSWLIKELYEYEQQSGNSLTFAQMKPLLEQAKEMEKQQIKNAWFDSTIQFDNSAEMTYKKDFEQYYNETFKKD